MALNRAHWAAVREAFLDDAKRRDRDAARLTPAQRLLLGLEMGAAMPQHEPSEHERAAAGFAKAQLHVRWRKLQAARAQKP